MSTNRTVRRTDGHRHSAKVIPVTIAMIFVVGVVSGTVTMSSAVSQAAPAVTAPWQVAAHATGAGGQPVCPNADAATELMPAPGFDPLTGSTAELRAQDFPPRPTHSADLAAWTDYAKRYLSGAAFVCPSDPTAPSSSNAGLVGVAGAQPGWAGWVLHNASFTDSSNEFVAAGATGGPDAYVAYWAGVNWVNTNHYPLIQAGLQVNGAGTSCQLIYDAYPVNPHDTGLGVCSYGNHIVSHVRIDASGNVTYHVTDMETGGNYPGSQTIAGATDRRACREHRRTNLLRQQLHLTLRPSRLRRLSVHERRGVRLGCRLAANRWVGVLLLCHRVHHCAWKHEQNTRVSGNRYLSRNLRRILVCTALVLREDWVRAQTALRAESIGRCSA